jgi:transposase
MEYVGIDLGKKRSDICILDEEGRVSGRLSVATPELPGWLQSRPPARMVMETSTQSRLIEKCALEAGHDVTVVPGHVVRTLGVGRRGLKTDKRDAEVLAYAAFRNPELPGVHRRSDEAVEVQKLLRMRSLCKGEQTKLVNLVKAELRALLLKTPSSRSPRFEELCRAQFAEAGVPVSLPLELAFESLGEISEKLARLDEAIEEAGPRDAIQRLRTIPGVGPIISATLWALIDNPDRFRTAQQVASYMGLVPGEQSTGGQIRRTGLIRAPKGLRPLLIQGAWTFMRTRPHDPLVKWALRIAKRRGKKVAVCALARKMAVIAWAILRTGRDYNPMKAAAIPNEVPLEEELANALRSSSPTAAARPEPSSTETPVQPTHG